MRGATVKKLKALAREACKDTPELFDVYYKAAKKIHKKVTRAK